MPKNNQYEFYENAPRKFGILGGLITPVLPYFAGSAFLFLLENKRLFEHTLYGKF
ncbi:hypothetical protein [Oceanobacillus jeddahense]|uniref:Uncharacterized protein n=1 Tax=Oceanobacillus jeddahense TaxID=1462527 RepID=A0ABY5K096_9BACI|nr:hypothetical protein [Oceanobacillus jeddahense]UUI04721.1 hypothetical protein NP439_08825 [Oceanobacillus jeddahense]